MKIEVMEFHPLADIFPMMSAEEYVALKDDIAKYGLREPITLAEDKIADGRNRYKACVGLGAEPSYEEWDGVGSLLAFIISKNLHRRHLSESQRAMVAAKIANMPAHRPEKNCLNLSTSQADAADLLNISRSGVQQAKKVLSEGTTELAEVVEQGKVAVSLAAKVAEWEIEKQEKFVDRVMEGVVPSLAKKQVDKEEKRQRYTASGEDMVLAAETYQLIRGDFAEVGLQLVDESVDVIITDPPYSKEYLHLYDLLAREAVRLLKPGGSLLVMSGQSYLPEVLRLLEQHLAYHWTIAYETPGGQAAMIRHRNVNTFWKPVFWFVKGKYEGDWRGDLVVSNMNDKRFHDWGQSEGGIGKLVADYTLPGDLVLDPFVGGGTTAVACIRLGRRFVGIDIEQEQIDITLGRLKDES